MKTTPCTENNVQTATKLYAFDLAPRCGAKTRSGTLCRSPAVKNKNRCRMHGGARGSGAPNGNKNAFKHGFTTLAEKTYRKEIFQLIKECKILIEPNAS